MKSNAIVCNRYRLYKASGNYDGKGEEIYTAMRATAVTKYITKHNIPVDLDTNAYFIECCHADKVLKRVSTYEFNIMSFDRLIVDDRGAYTMRRG